MARASSAKSWLRGRPRRRSHGPTRSSIVRITGSSSASRSDASTRRFGGRRGLMRRTLATCGRPLACPPAATSLPAGYTLAAQAKGPELGIYDNPSAPAPAKTVPNPWLLNNEADKQIPQVFLVEEQRPDWVKVLLADRPNGSIGWVRASDVQLTPNPYHLQVRLGDHKITVFQGTNSIYEGQVAIGAPDTPTPPGEYYTRILIQAPDPNTVYGPFAYGLSAHSEVLDEYNGGDAEVGVHGNDDASVLGKSVTHGCIRMDNDEITKLSKVLPLGTPVEIVS